MRKALVLAVVMVLLQGVSLGAQMVNPSGLQWDASTAPDLAEYRVYQSGTAGTYPAEYTSVPAGQTTVTLSDCPEGQVYWRITAVDVAGNESVACETTGVFETVPPDPPTGCTPIP